MARLLFPLLIVIAVVISLTALVAVGLIENRHSCTLQVDGGSPCR